MNQILNYRFLKIKNHTQVDFLEKVVLGKRDESIDQTGVA